MATPQGGNRIHHCFMLYSIYLKLYKIIITSPTLVGWSIATSVSVCLFVCLSAGVSQ